MQFLQETVGVMSTIKKDLQRMVETHLSYDEFCMLNAQNLLLRILSGCLDIDQRNIQFLRFF